MKRERVKQFLATCVGICGSSLRLFGLWQQWKLRWRHGGGWKENLCLWGYHLQRGERGSRISIPTGYSGGWACIRYGVGETLFRFNDAMELEPWRGGRIRECG